METNALLIFSGYNTRAVIAFCRYALQKEISFFIVAIGFNDPIYKSLYVKNIINNRDKDLSITDILLYVQKVKNLSNKEKVVILPSTEYLNRYLLGFKNILDQNKIIIGLCDKNIYELISNKHSFGKLCNSFNIKTPATLEKHVFKFPVVVKPKTYIDNNKVIYKPELIYSKEKLKSFFTKRDKDHFYIQEFVGGRCVYLLYYVFSDGTYSVYSQENFVQQYNGGSIILAKASSFHKSSIGLLFAKLFAKTGFSGLIMVELKLFENEYYMIEANPRLWGPSQLIIDAGMDLFECFAKENNLIDNVEKKIYKKETWYYWEGGKIKNELNGLPLMYHNFNQRDFVEKLEELDRYNIYKRDDTIKIYENENN